MALIELTASAKSELQEILSTKAGMAVRVKIEGFG